MTTTPGTAPPSRYVMRTVAEADESYLLELTSSRETIEAAMRGDGFTPVLGAGCSRIGHHSFAEHARTGVRMSSLLALSPGLSEDARQYVSSLAAMQQVPLLELAKEDTDDDGLIESRAAIAELAAVATQVFAAAMADDCMPAIAGDRYGVSILESERFGELRVRLLRAIAEASRIEQDPTSFGSHGITVQLIALSLGLFDGWEPEGEEEKALLKLRSDLIARKTYFRSPKVPRGMLYVYQLAWLAELLWHTFNFDSPIYPSTTEFAFRLSVACVTKQDEAENPPLALATLRAEEDWLPEVQRILRRCHSAGREHDGVARRRDFYGALARVMRWQFQQWMERPGLKPMPLVVSTNYDVEMEQAFHEAGVPFHVLIPVELEILTGDAADDQVELRWVWTTVLPQQDALHAQWQWWNPPDRDKPPPLQGPLLLKLHGSPLHDLDSTRALRDLGLAADRQLRAAAVLSEFEYLRALAMENEALPPGIDFQLQQKRRKIYFLGQSVSDWNIRLRIFHSVFLQRTGNGAEDATVGGKPPAFWAINRSFDPMRASLLRMLGLSLVSGELEDLTGVMEEVADRPNAGMSRSQS